MSSSKFPPRLFLRTVDINDLNFNGAEGDVHCIYSPTSYFITHAEKYISEKEHAATITSLQAENERLKDQATEWERLANSWREDYDELKNKYEPMIAVTSEALKTQGEAQPERSKEAQERIKAEMGKCPFDVNSPLYSDYFMSVIKKEDQGEK